MTACARARAPEASRRAAPLLLLPLLLALLLPLLLAASGCARWWHPLEPPISDNPFVTPRMSPDSVAVEYLILAVPSHGVGDLEQVWKACEEPLTIEQRRLLEQNGIWCGVTTSQLPAPVRRWLDEPVSAFPEESGWVPGPGQRVQCRAGQRKPILCGPLRDELSLLVRDVDEKLTGKTFKQVHTQLALRVFPLGNGQVRVQLIPEIEHGEARPRHVAGEGLWQVRVAKDREVWEPLAATVTVTPGQTVIVGSTPDAKGLGRGFFQWEGRHLLVLVRVAQTQADNLFAPEQIVAPRFRNAVRAADK